MKNLIKFAVVVITLMVACPAFAQTEEEVQEPVSYKVYCELVGSRLPFSMKMNVDLDFGQFVSWWSSDRKIADEDGNIITFNSMLDAANYMARRGWELEEAFVTMSISKGDSNSPNYHWIMSKTVTSDEQITEGLLTVGMTKKR